MTRPMYFLCRNKKGSIKDATLETQLIREEFGGRENEKRGREITCLCERVLKNRLDYPASGMSL